MLELDEHLRAHVPKENTFDWLMDVQGQVHRAVKNRRTVEFHLGGRHYFIKAHRGVGWREVLKNWLYGRAPIVSAEPEWRAIAALNAAGVAAPSVAGKGLRGQAPARLESFIVMHALEGMISLEDLAKDWHGACGKTRILLKRALIQQLASVARALHGAGLNHRDFYLCHFLTRDRDWSKWTPADAVQLTLIDLHRVQIREARNGQSSGHRNELPPTGGPASSESKQPFGIDPKTAAAFDYCLNPPAESPVPSRWLVKDLGALFYSAFDAGLTRRDALRFLGAYRQRPWREVLEQEGAFWKRVRDYALKLYRSFHRREPPAHL